MSKLLKCDAVILPEI